MRYGRVVSLFSAAVLALALFATAADARIGGGSSSGSRGSRTFSAPPITNTAPRQGSEFNRTVTPQPGPTAGQPATAGGGFFNRPGGLFGGGLLGGLAAGFIGAGLFGMLFGHGFLGGMGGFASLIGLLLQIALVVVVVRLVMAWWQRRNQPAYAMPLQNQSAASFRDMFGGSGSGSSARGPAQPSDSVGITPSDYDAFERLLTDLQAAYSNEDVATLRRLATPEMVSYFSEDLAANASEGLVNRVRDVKLVQGDLAEAWREGGTDYATVAMKISLVDQMIDRATGRVVQGDDRPEEVTEMWTFLRSRGGNWILSAIQQA
jgi:predicted lipid-binding transport protein (Tim44 family)